MSRVPPRRLLALPMVDTVTSMAWPGLAKGGRLPLTVTAATFFSCRRVSAGIWTPKRFNIAFRLCTVKGVWPV